MKTLAKRAEHAYGDLGLGSAIKSLNVAIRKIREGQDVINPLIPYDE
jgi:isocitrate dehydrogenase